MNEATTNLGPRQVRGKSESTCPRRADVEILGVVFCGRCASEPVPMVFTNITFTYSEGEGVGVRYLSLLPDTAVLT